MKTKGFMLCLLFLMLGTTVAWADKYYRVGVRDKDSLEVGKKYMIFNTTFDGTQNRSGFLYNMGTTFGLKRFTSVDKYLCGEAFVFELEDAGDNDPHTFYLKSTASSGYMNLDGQQSVTPTVLNIYTWDEARAGDEYIVSESGVTINEKNNIKQACVKSYNSGYTVVTENNITSESNAVYVIANENNSWYFNGDVEGYATWTEGHPYAFYECVEATGAETFDISELHIYSRADFYSAQQMYGYITDASQITSFPLYNGKPFEGEGAIANLIDGNYKSYNITNWNNNNETHYYQIDLKTSVESLRLYMATRSDKKHAPVVYELWATNNPAGEWTKIDLGVNNTTTLKENLVYISPIINLGASYRYIRIQAPAKRSNAEQCLALSELYVLPNREEINTAIAYFDHTLPAAGTEAVYKAIIDERNANPVASAVKLFSGVPVPGNKYRIYADAYSDGVYVNRHISIKVADGEYELAANGDYYQAAGDEQEAFEWYCEESSDGKLLFRNVKYPTYYLSNCTVTTDINSAGWEMETNYTQHQGVPLKNVNYQYLAVFNHGDYWQGDVQKPMNQKVTTGKLDYQNTPDKADDDIDANGGLCTDFVFIPVDLDADEVRLTITASELANRNSTLTVGGTVYELPFSKVFYDDVPEITITSTAGEFHAFTGFYKNGTFIGDTIDNTLFTNSTLVSGDEVEARFQVDKLPQVSTTDNIVLYQIKSRSGKSVSQNAGQSRTGLGYDNEDDEDNYTSMEGSKNYYYASFATKNTPLNLFYNESELKANTFFYFTNDDAQVGENYMVYINSAITTFRCNKPNEWTSGGQLYNIQPNAVSGGKYGFAITLTQLTAGNNPLAWNSQYTDAGNTVVEYNSEDANSAWEFVQVDKAVATEKLTLYIKETAAGMIVDLTGKLDTPGFDNDKINHTIGVIEDIAGEYNEADSTFSGGNIIDASVTSLVGYAQELHMLHHEAEYAMQALPEPTNEDEIDFQPAWYYIKNVNTQYYARYQGADNLMTLTGEIGNNKLPHLFYFAGEKINKGTKDEYIAAHIHNFMALNLKDATKDSTIVSYNRELLTTDVAPKGDGSQTKIYLSEAQYLKNSEAWRLELDFDLTSGAFFNGWGSGLLASGGNGTATQDGGTYEDGFQVYLQNDGDVVIRGGDSGAGDGYIFSHAVGKYSKMKVVLTYANYRLQVAVTNSEGVTQTIKDTPTGINKKRDYIPCEFMMNVTEMASAMAGASSFKLKAEVVLAMKWDTHENNQAAGKNGDKWYILPSSNTEFPGLAIVTDGADDTNMGWSNVNGENKEIFTGPGVDDFSTWQFEKVEVYNNHIQELLDLYDIKDCIIYDKRLVELYNAIQEIVNSGRDDEEIFNDLFNLIRNYDGPSPAELRAPKPGSFYTIRPLEDENTKNALQVHVDGQNANYRTTEVYNATAIDADADVDSRAVWIFEGNNFDADGYYVPSALKVKNIHTQAYIEAMGADATKLTANDAATFNLTPGACTAIFKTGDKYMAMLGDNRIDYTKNSHFWGFALDKYPAQVKEIVKTFNAGKVHGKSMDVVVETEGNVTVTFTHNGGSHKLNILGVKLTDANGNMVNEVYHHGEAGGSLVNNVYDLGNVAPGTYTLHSFVWDYDDDPSSDEDDKVESAQGYITVAGATGVKGLTNTGTENTKWIVEEIKNPEESIYYTVAKLSNSPTGTPDSRAYSSLYLGFDAKIPADITAWIVDEVFENNVLNMIAVDGGIVPANTGVILTSGGAMTNQKFYLSTTASQFDTEGNILSGTTYAIIEDCSKKDIYMLSMKSNRIAMYWAYENRDASGNKLTIDGTTNHNEGGYLMCNANKSYLEIFDEPAASSFGFFFSGNTTDLDEVSDGVKGENGNVKTIYDLQGRKLVKVTSPGIYIVDGKKVYVTEIED